MKEVFNNKKIDLYIYIIYHYNKIYYIYISII